MPKKPHQAHLMELAKRGAEVQLNDLLHEAKMLLDLFPHLRDSFDKDELPVSFLLKRGYERPTRKVATASRPRPRKRVWTTAERRRAARRMKAYWSKRKSAGRSRS